MNNACRIGQCTACSGVMLAVVALLAGSADRALGEQILVPADFPTVQEAIDASVDGDVIIISPGTYTGQINPWGRAITIRSTDPNDPAIVEQTILDGGGADVVVEIFSGERATTVVEGLTISGGNGDTGGGIAIATADPTIRLCVFRNNNAVQGGGAYLYVSSALFDRCTFAYNTASRGGAAYLYACTLPRFNGCTFTGNLADVHGGGVATFFAQGRFYRCLIADNAAGSNGGGYYGNNSGSTFVGSLIRDNTASYGGGLYLDDESSRISNTTIVQNAATVQGGAGAVYAIFSQPVIYNSIIRDNAEDPYAPGWYNIAAEYSNIEGGALGVANIDADPLFVNADENDFRLLAGSPSIDTGFNGWIPSYDFDDLAGNDRILDSNVDMGAFEADGAPLDPVTPTGQLIVALHDEGNRAYGVPLPILAYDVNTDQWTELVRDLPTFAFTADAEARCFWALSSDTGLLCRIPYDTMQLEEVALVTYQGRSSIGLSGMAVRDGVLYASTPFYAGTQPEGLYTIDMATGNMQLLNEFDSEFEVWDLHYESDTDRMLLLSNNQQVPPGPLGIFEIDLETYETTEIQPWINANPFNQVNGLQGLATGAGMNFLFRSLYDDLQVYDAVSQDQIGTLNVPAPKRGGSGWVFGGLTWVENFEDEALAGDHDGDGDIDLADYAMMTDCLTRPEGAADAACAVADHNADGDVDLQDVGAFFDLLTAN